MDGGIEESTTGFTKTYSYYNGASLTSREKSKGL